MNMTMNLSVYILLLFTVALAIVVPLVIAVPSVEGTSFQRRTLLEREIWSELTAC